MQRTPTWDWGTPTPYLVLIGIAEAVFITMTLCGAFDHMLR